MAKRREYPISKFLDLVVTYWTQQERHDPNVEQTSPTFGFVHAFFAIMGGFAFPSEYDDKTSTVDENLFTLPVQRGAVYKVPSFHGLVYIMKHFPHLITNVPEETILGLAQSDSISKALLIVQVGWFCTNCASRLDQNLPLSLLEVTTAAHAVCTLLTYVVWWSKPLNIPEPIVLRGKEAQEVWALLRCSSIEYDEALEMAQRMAGGMAAGVPREGDRAMIFLAANALLRILQMGKIPEKPPSDLFVGRILGRVVTGISGRFSVRVLRGIFDSLPGSFRNASRNDPVVEWTITAVSPILYGLIHLLAWSDHFPTPLERRIWRVSSVVVTCSGLVGVLLLLIFEFLRRSLLHPNRSLVGLVAFLALYLLPVVHVLASGFLLVESFRQLFFLDPAAYQLPSWSNYWPHLS